MGSSQLANSTNGFTNKRIYGPLSYRDALSKPKKLPLALFCSKTGQCPLCMGLLPKTPKKTR